MPNPNIQNHEDILLAKLVVAYGMITHDVAVKLLKLKEKSNAQKKNQPLGELMLKYKLITESQSQKLFELRDQVLLQCNRCQTVYRFPKYKLNSSPTCKTCQIPLPVPERLPSLKEEDFTFTFDQKTKGEGIFSILAGTHVGKSFTIKQDEPFKIGRTEEMSLQLSDGAISRHHCTLSLSKEKYHLEDCNSRWGTYVNGKKITQAPLEFGDLIRIGYTVVEFRPKGKSEVTRSPSMMEALPQKTQFIHFPMGQKTQEIPQFSEFSRNATLILQPIIDSAVNTPSPQNNPTTLQPILNDLEESEFQDLENPPPDFIHGYVIQKKLGAGKMGVVYRALQKETNQYVALKIMKPPEKNQNERIKRFIQEARIINQIDNLYIIKGCDFGVSEPYFFVAMELFDGYPVSSFLTRYGVFSEKRAALVLVHMARALVCMEKHNLLHRDIKPSNILLNRRRSLSKLCDLGLAKMLDENLSLTKIGCAVGTPFYNSPEVAQGLKDIDIRSDMYSLGSTLFHLVVGDVPFRAETTVDILIKHVRAPVPDIAKLAPQISKRMAGILTKMMAKKPENRFSNAEALLESLKPYFKAVDEMEKKMVPDDNPAD